MALEWIARQRLDELLWQEFNLDSLDAMQALLDGLPGLAEEHPDTPAGMLAGAHAGRMEPALAASREATEAAEEESRATERHRLEGSSRGIKRLESQ